MELQTLYDLQERLEAAARQASGLPEKTFD